MSTVSSPQHPSARGEEGWGEDTADISDYPHGTLKRHWEQKKKANRSLPKYFYKEVLFESSRE